MSRREDVVSKHRDAIRQAAARRKADSIALVGSVARGDDGDGSDYDFLVRFVEGASLFDLAGLQLDLEELLGRHVDVISVRGLKEEHQGMLSDAITL
ncbi:MAG: nucleotidyltransferase domain-containing protein [Acidimicrobiaceae bacterium]|nr:nucleotidyltransferase domain-containing protein [Acidimicrobiaceae bacterium]